MTPTLVLDTKMTLGEGPVWNHLDHKFYCVDIQEKRIYSFDPVTDVLKKYTLPEKIGVAVPTIDGKLIVGLQDGIAVFNPEDTSLKYVANIEKEVIENRFNDGKCDAAGRFWAGTMHINELPGKGSLYSFDGRSVKKHLSGISVSNGLDWSADNKRFFMLIP
ncbi:SMP-30/gluconolactonase/LRE family protein [Fulvivirgaceae bacterium BMA12]|uniref:SMP-30/gluconolactonase/LRE family protein n=1 Tax=Agaribacillus aureus TaxID=3051825 RepID=A0ABT8LIH8_9BACT|nr:SMP-30/gluconolactonase/LRE family protein [Fulvivirgaceae bacterium BMA12]